jgi:hypothetical protein
VAIALNGRRDRLQCCAPAPLAHFVRVDEIIGSLVALRALNRHGARKSSNAQSARTRLAFDPFAEFHRDVSVVDFAVCALRIFGRNEKRPGPHQYDQPHCHQYRQYYEKRHVPHQFHSERSTHPTRRTYAPPWTNSQALLRRGFQLSTSFLTPIRMSPFARGTLCELTRGLN